MAFVYGQQCCYCYCLCLFAVDYAVRAVVYDAHLVCVVSAVFTVQLQLSTAPAGRQEPPLAAERHTYPSPCRINIIIEPAQSISTTTQATSQSR